MQGKEKLLTPYQILLMAILTVLQFTHALDFMIISPLGAMLTRLLHISPAEFGFVVSAYTFSAGAAGILSAAIADKFDRKKMLVFFYSGFIVGTFLCAWAPSYELLLAARIIAGAFGGVLASITLTIIGDVFPQQVRGRAMGVIQTSFSISQIAGIPLGLFIANRWGWHTPFVLIGLLGVTMLVVVLRWMRPVDGHLKTASPQEKKPLVHLQHIVSVPHHLLAFGVTALLAITGFVVIPYMSTFIVYNLGIPEQELPVLYLSIGIAGLLSSLLAGRLTDSLGAYKVYMVASSIVMVAIPIFTNLSHTTLAMLIGVNILLIVGIMGRTTSAMTLLTSVPEPQNRGAFMSINSAVQQISAGLAAMLGGLIVTPLPDKSLSGFPTLGVISVGVVLLSMVGLYLVQRHVAQKNSAKRTVASN